MQNNPVASSHQPGVQADTSQFEKRVELLETCITSAQNDLNNIKNNMVVDIMNKLKAFEGEIEES